jgi:hypothetical protein
MLWRRHSHRPAAPFRSGWRGARKSGPETVSIVQIFRIRDGKIAMIRDYFTPEHAG